jgi:hypothetical protein
MGSRRSSRSTSVTLKLGDIGWRLSARIYHTIALLALSPRKRNGGVCGPGVVGGVFRRGGVEGGLRYREEKKNVGKRALEMNLLEGIDVGYLILETVQTRPTRLLCTRCFFFC